MLALSSSTGVMTGVGQAAAVEPVSEDVTEHQGCQQAAASTSPFKPLPCAACALSICLHTARNKEVGSCAFFSFHTHINLCIPILTDFTGSTKTLLVCSHQCLQQDCTGGFQTVGHLDGTCPEQGSTVPTPSIHLQFKNRDCRFLWASPLDYSKVNT